MGMEVGVATETVAGQGGRKRRRGGHKTSRDTERGDVQRKRAALPVRVRGCVFLCNPCAIMCNGQWRKCVRASAA